jgi:hypothetical protein
VYHGRQPVGDCPTFRISMVGTASHCADFANAFTGAAMPTPLTVYFTESVASWKPLSHRHLLRPPLMRNEIALWAEAGAKIGAARPAKKCCANYVRFREPISLHKEKIQSM